VAPIPGKELESEGSLERNWSRKGLWKGIGFGRVSGKELESEGSLERNWSRKGLRKGIGGGRVSGKELNPKEFEPEELQIGNWTKK
jgi:muconolactone delta-isomerase